MQSNTHRNERRNSQTYAKQRSNLFRLYLDNSRNQYYKFEGGDCVQNMLEQLRLVASRCVKEQQENAKMELTADDVKNYRKAKISIQSQTENCEIEKENWLDCKIKWYFRAYWPNE